MDEDVYVDPVPLFEDDLKSPRGLFWSPRLQVAPPQIRGDSDRPPSQPRTPELAVPTEADGPQQERFGHSAAASTPSPPPPPPLSPQKTPEPYTAPVQAREVCTMTPSPSLSHRALWPRSPLQTSNSNWRLETSPLANIDANIQSPVAAVVDSAKGSPPQKEKAAPPARPLPPPRAYNPMDTPPKRSPYRGGILCLFTPPLPGDENAMPMARGEAQENEEPLPALTTPENKGDKDDYELQLAIQASLRQPSSAALRSSARSRGFLR